MSSSSLSAYGEVPHLEGLVPAAAHKPSGRHQRHAHHILTVEKKTRTCEQSCDHCSLLRRQRANAYLIVRILDGINQHAAIDVPDSYASVFAARRKESIPQHLKTANSVGVARKSLHTLARVRIPYTQRLILRACRQATYSAASTALDDCNKQS